MYFLLQDLYKSSNFSSLDIIKDNLYNWIKKARKSKLKKFKKLLDLGVISQEEFDVKRKELLGL